MKWLIFLWLISGGECVFNGCPIDGCESSLSSFVDIRVEGFAPTVQWRRTDLLNQTSRGCVSNNGDSLICVIDRGYAGLNMTTGELLWSVPIASEERSEAAALPIVNDRGYAIVSNSSRSTLIGPEGDVLGTFNYIPSLQSPLAGPTITSDGQIIVADLTSFVGIEDSGIPLGVLDLPSGYLRFSRSISLNPTIDRWYLITAHNGSATRAIVAAETTGQIVERLRIAWLYEYERQADQCNGKEGPLLSIDRHYLFLVNSTGILVVADEQSSASTESFIPRPKLCTADMAFSEADGTLFIVEERTFTILLYNLSTHALSELSLANLSGAEIIGQISRLTLLQANRLLITVLTASRQAVVLLIDYNRGELLSRFDLGEIRQAGLSPSLAQLVFSENDAQEKSLTLAHPSIGLVTIGVTESSAL